VTRSLSETTNTADAAAMRHGSWRWRAAIPAINLALLAAAVALYLWARPIYMSILSGVMLRPSTPFIDFQFILTNVTCWQRGVNVYISNPCDPLNRPMDYSPLWLRMNFLGIDTSWTPAFGLAIAVLFCLSLAVLSPTRRRRDQVAIGLASVSPLCVYGLERGNTDMIVYLVALAAGLVLARKTIGRLTGYGFLIAAGLLKFYPIVALVVVFRERLWPCIVLAIASIVIFLCFIFSYYHELIASVANIPRASYFWTATGAKVLPGGIGFVLQPILAQIGAAAWESAPSSRALIYAVSAILIASVCAVVASIATSAECRQQIAVLPPRYGILLQIGTALIVGCFFAGRSECYRDVNLLLTLPGLALLAHPYAPRHLRCTSGYTIAAILVVMYRLPVIGVLSNYGLGPKNSAIAGILWIGFELLWWWIVAVLLAFFACLLYESAAGHEIRALLVGSSHRFGLRRGLY
jgi:hypothetical protein